MQKIKNLRGSRNRSSTNNGVKNGTRKNISATTTGKKLSKSSKISPSVKIAGEKNSTKDELTKTFLETAAQKSMAEAAKETMKVMGYNVIARDGWVVKVFPNKTVEKISPIPPVTENK